MKATLTIILDRKGRAKGTDREAPLDVRVIKEPFGCFHA